MNEEIDAIVAPSSRNFLVDIEFGLTSNGRHYTIEANAVDVAEFVGGRHLRHGAEVPPRLLEVAWRKVVLDPPQDRLRLTQTDLGLA